MTDTELHELFERLQLPDLGRGRVSFICDNPPSCAVRSNKASGKTRYTGIEMPFVIEAEAMSSECIRGGMDHDDATWAYDAKPQPL